MSGLVAAASLRELFKALLEEAVRQRHVSVTETTEFYLVNLLTEFASAESLFSEAPEGGKELEPLAVMYHRAKTQDREGQIRTLRRMGDVSLYTAGFFSDSLRTRAVGPDYYIQMGGAAYEQVADLAARSGYAEVYRELGAKFRPLVEVLEAIAARNQMANGAVGTLRVYETWQRTKDGTLERMLVDAGLVTPKSGLSN